MADSLTPDQKNTLKEKINKLAEVFQSSSSISSVLTEKYKNLITEVKRLNSENEEKLGQITELEQQLNEKVEENRGTIGDKEAEEFEKKVSEAKAEIDSLLEENENLKKDLDIAQQHDGSEEEDELAKLREHNVALERAIKENVISHEASEEKIKDQFAEEIQKLKESNEHFREELAARSSTTKDENQERMGEDGTSYEASSGGSSDQIYTLIEKIENSHIDIHSQRFGDAPETKPFNNEEGNSNSEDGSDFKKKSSESSQSSTLDTGKDESVNITNQLQSSMGKLFDKLGQLVENIATSTTVSPPGAGLNELSEDEEHSNAEKNDLAKNMGLESDAGLDEGKGTSDDFPEVVDDDELSPIEGSNEIDEVSERPAETENLYKGFNPYSIGRGGDLFGDEAYVEPEFQSTSQGTKPPKKNETIRDLPKVQAPANHRMNDLPKTDTNRLDITLHDDDYEKYGKHLKLTYLFDSMPNDVSFSKFKKTLRNACRITLLGNLEEGLALFDTLKQQRIPLEYKEMIDKNIRDVKYYLRGKYRSAEADLD